MAVRKPAASEAQTATEGPAPAAPKHRIKWATVLTDPYEEPFISVDGSPLFSAMAKAVDMLDKDPNSAAAVAKDLRRTIEGTELTLGHSCVAALNTPIPSDKDEGEKAKFGRFLMACKIVEAEENDTALDWPPGGTKIELLKKRLAAAYPNATLVGRAWMLLDPNSTDE